MRASRVLSQLDAAFAAGTLAAEGDHVERFRKIVRPCSAGERTSAVHDVRVQHHDPSRRKRLLLRSGKAVSTSSSVRSPFRQKRLRDHWLICSLLRPLIGAGGTERSARNLLASREAGDWGRMAGGRRLMLTRFWPGNGRAAAVEAAQEGFGGRSWRLSKTILFRRVVFAAFS